MREAILVGGSTARVIEDSRAEGCPRLTTLHLRYPRMVHAEAKTHRRIGKFPGAVLVEDDVSLMGDQSLSRNGRSSRAVPVAKLLAEPTYVPDFRRNQKGMQARGEFTAEELANIEYLWRTHAELCRDLSRELGRLGVHKQWANRPLEWFGHIDTLITVSGNNWPNFFALRMHEAAQPEMQDLAQAIHRALQDSDPKVLGEGEWHLPYADDDDWRRFPQDIREGGDGYSYDEALAGVLKLSVVRCARISYSPFDGDDTDKAENARYELLMGSSPLHASPAEHQAMPDSLGAHPQSNLHLWAQYRKMIPGESA